jgi:urease accessory protein
MHEQVLWQLVDSAFPTGGFAHSGGLEAAVQAGLIPDEAALRAWLQWSLANGLSAGCGYINIACAEPDRLLEWDAHAHTTVINPVARRASLAQGQALISSAAAAWPEHCAADKKAMRAAAAPGHQAPVLGAIAGRLGFTPEVARNLFAWQLLRDQVSAAVRLNRIGPMRAQRLLTELAPDTSPWADDGPDDVATLAPLVDLTHSGHDRLYSRLFQS